MTLKERLRDLSPEKRQRLLAELEKRKKNLSTGGGGDGEYQPIRAVEKREYYPLSASQKRFYILNHFTEYQVPTTMMAEGPLDPARFELAFQKLVDRHESLRTCFIEINGEPFQRIGEHVDFKVAYHDLCHLTLEERTAAEEGREDSPLGPVLAQLFARFDLTRAPLMRVALIKLEENKHLVLHNMHHIIADGASKRILSHEFSQLYKGETLPALPIRYRDFAVCQDRQITGGDYRRHREYWQSQYRDSESLPVLDIPTDYPRPPMQNFEGRRIPFDIGGETFRALKALTLRENVSFYMALLALYNTLLYRYSGQEDIIIGTVTAGRLRPEVQPLMGIFINPLSLRNQPVGQKTFREFLRDLKQNTLQAYEHQSFPFGDLLDMLIRKKDLSRNPLFDALIILHNMFIDVGRPQVGEVAFLPYVPKFKTPGHAQQDLALLAVEKRDKIEIEIEYCTAIFKPQTIRRMAGHFLTLLQDAAANPDTRLSHLQLITSREKEQLLESFNNKHESYPEDKTFIDLFRRQVSENPGNIAVIDPERQDTINYTQLDRRSGELAYNLIQQGVQPGDIVAIKMERSIDVYIAVLGIFKAGAAYLPIDPNYPQDRIDYMIADSRAGITITDTDIIVNETKKPQPGATVPNLCYIIYTSGTTGRPKGVVVDHGNFINAAYGWISEYALDSMPVNLLQMASFSFDVFAGDLARGLLTGGKTVICPDEARVDPPALYNIIHEHHITLFESTPSLIIPLMQYVYENKLPIDTLKLLILGSDACPVEDFRRIMERFGGRMRIINSYGLTEATIDSGYYEEPVDKLPAAGNVPIGKPMPNTEYYILDTHGNIQPVGLPGELYIGGKGVARGYLNNPTLTYEKFSSIQDKSFWESRTLFTKSPSLTGSRYPAPRGAAGGKLYKTGDLCRWLEDGNVEFSGRIDTQVKLRGLRIELGEIESRILQFPGISEAVVLVRDDKNSEKYLCAYFVPLPGLDTPIETGRLRDYLSRSLPGYMVPTRYMQLDKIPLTPNGKVDRKALPQIDHITGSEYIPPRNPTEEKLVGLWAEILKQDAGTISIMDNFFHIGGQSILAMKLLNRVRNTFEVKIPLPRFFQVGTVSGLAAYISQHAGSEGNKEAVNHPGVGKLQKRERRTRTLKKALPIISKS